MKCEVCYKLLGRYKCPRCFMTYCSVDCYKTHQVNLCEERRKKRQIDAQLKVKSDESQNAGQLTSRQPVVDDDSEDKVSEDALKKLGESGVISDMLSNQHLVRMLCHLDTTPRPDVDVEAAMHEPIFTEFVDECLRIVDPQTN